MSYCSLYTINEKQELTEYEQYCNSYGGAAYIWDALAIKYLDVKSFIFLANDYSKLWDLYKDPRLSKCEKLSLLSTFDYIIVEKDNLVEMAESYKEFMTMYPNTKNFVCHLLEWSEDIIKISQNKSIVGICFYHCSVSESVWCDYDLSLNNNHFYLSEELT